MSGEVADLFQVGQHSVRCEVAHHHVVDHPLTQGRNPAGGKDGVVNRCGVAHGEQQYRKISSDERLLLTYRTREWGGRKVVTTKFPRSGLVQCELTFRSVTVVSGYFQPSRNALPSKRRRG